MTTKTTFTHNNSKNNTSDNLSSEEEKCPYASFAEQEPLLQQCPAFSNSCPFANKSAQEIQQQLLQVPSSHLEHDNKNNTIGANFRSLLQNLHTIHPHNKFQLNECPVQSKVHTATLQDLEGWSLGHIMAQMAEEMDREMSHGPVDATTMESNNNNNKLSQMMMGSSTVPKTSTNNNDTLQKQQQQQKRASTLSESFKHGTVAAHEAAENVHFVKNFIRGHIDRHLYGQLVIQLYHVYTKLEECLQEHQQQCTSLEPFVQLHQDLRRRDSLLEDLDYWHTDVGGIVAGGDSISPATLDYVNRLQDICTKRPLLLLSHAYTRYLGDLSGGKILARVAKRALDCGDNGLAFYHFDDIASAKKFKDTYRATLDALQLSSNDIQELVAEANVAFVLNVRMFEELDVMANVEGAQVRPLQHALEFATLQAVQVDDPTAECPFLVKNNKQTKEKEEPQAKSGRCPWPFIVLHDPKAALEDWQTWVVIGLVLCFVYSKL